MADRLLYPQWRRNGRLLPAGAITFDRSHPLRPDRLYIPAFRQADLISGARRLTANASPGTTLTYAGPAATFTGGSGFSAGSGAFLGGRAAWSICALVQTATPTSGSGGTVYCERAASGNDIVKLHISQTTGSAACAYQNDAGSLVNQTAGSPSVTDGLVHMMACTYDGTNVASYVDRALVQTTSWPGANNNFTNGALQQTIGYDVADATGPFAGSIIAIWLYQRALTAAQIATLTDAPFAMLRPAGSYTQRGPTASLGVTLTASASARSQTRTTGLLSHINVAARVKTRSSVRLASFPSTVVLRGRVSGRSAAHLLQFGATIVVLGGKAAARSRAGTVATITNTRTRQNAVGLVVN